MTHLPICKLLSSKATQLRWTMAATVRQTELVASHQMWALIANCWPMVLWTRIKTSEMCSMRGIWVLNLIADRLLMHPTIYRAKTWKKTKKGRSGHRVTVSKALVKCQELVQISTKISKTNQQPRKLRVPVTEWLRTKMRRKKQTKIVMNKNFKTLETKTKTKERMPKQLRKISTELQSSRKIKRKLKKTTLCLTSNKLRKNWKTLSSSQSKRSLERANQRMNTMTLGEKPLWPSQKHRECWTKRNWCS